MHNTISKFTIMKEVVEVVEVVVMVVVVVVVVMYHCVLLYNLPTVYNRLT